MPSDILRIHSTQIEKENKQEVFINERNKGLVGKQIGTHLHSLLGIETKHTRRRIGKENGHCLSSFINSTIFAILQSRTMQIGYDFTNSETTEIIASYSIPLAYENCLR